MKKLKLLLIVATLLLSITALCVCANAATYSGTCSNEWDSSNLTWTLNTSTGVLEIDGTGAMKDWSLYSSAPWDSYRSSIKSVTLGDGVTSIGEWAFYSCDALTSVDMPNVTSVGGYAFLCCDALASVEIPASTTSIGSEAFSSCTSLEGITVDDANTYYSSDNFGVLFNKNKSTLIQYPIGNSRTSYSVPSTVTSIGDYAFEDCYALTSVEIPNVTSIGSWAFASCDALTSVEIPACTTSISSGAFRHCSNLKKATIYSKTATFSGSSVFSSTHADFEIHGYTGSTAETYANANGHTFVPICEEHNYEFNSELSVAPTCTEGGTNVYVCTECGNTYEESVPAIGHVNTTVTTVGATCTEEGSITETCDNCGEVISFESISALGHSMGDWEETVAPQPGVEGEERRDCERDGCDYYETRPVDALPTREILAQGYCGGEGDGTNLEWILYADGELVITGTGGMKDWSSSSSVPWYSYRSSIKTVTLGDGVTSMGDYAFYYCGALTSVDMPSVKSIGRRAFCDCDALTSVDMPASVTSIGNQAFSGCDALTSVDMPNVTSIGSDAFYSCDALTSVEIPACTTSIGSYAFRFCTSLESITVDDANTYYSSDNYGALFNKDKSTLIQYPVGNSRTSYSVPSTVTSFGNYAFYNCDALTSVDMPNVTSIGYDAFYDCYALTSVDMPKVTSIGDSAFYNCDALTSVDMPRVTSIGEWAFYDCDALTSVDMPKVTSIRSYAFSNCSNLKKATIYSKTATFYSSVFYNTHADFEIHGYRGSTAETYANNNSHTFVPIREILAQGYCGGEGDGTNLEWILYTDGELEISGTGAMEDWIPALVPWSSYRSSIKIATLADGVTNIGMYAFQKCNTLTSVEIPVSVTKISNDVFESCTALTSVSMPSVTEIGSSAFESCTSLSNVEMPNVIKIGSDAFNGCISLSDFELPNIKSIDPEAFANCTSLTSVELFGNVSSIGWSAFENCTNLKKATIRNKSIYFMSDVFANTHADFEIHGYAGSTAETYANENGHTFVPIRDIYVQGYCGANGTNLEWILYTDGELVITGTGAMAVYSGVTTAPWYVHNDSNAVKKITVNDSVTTIGDYAFYNLRSVTDVKLSSSLTSIGANAFNTCVSVEKIEIPSSLTNIGTYAFAWCGNLKTVVIPSNSSMTTLGEYAFVECTELESIVLPNGITSIGSQTFRGCSGLKSVEFPVNLTSIGEDAFSGCSALESIELPDKVTRIHEEAFRACSNLTNIYISENSTLSRVDYRAFTYCRSLESVVLPASVTMIGGEAFAYCSNLQTATIYSTTARFISNVFKDTHADFAIHGYRGSTAEAYANANGHTFVPIECVGEHNYELNSELSVAPTCTEGGKNVYVCTECGNTYEENVSALGHDEIPHAAQAQGCENIGWNAYVTCSRCDYSTYEELPALGHDYPTTPNSNTATCTTSGMKTYICNRGCGIDKTENSPALGHDEIPHAAQAQGCESIGWNAYVTCSRCDYSTYEELPMLGHSMGDWEETVAPQPGVAGEERRDCERDGCDYYETRLVDALPVREILAQGYCGGEGDGTNLSWILYAAGELVISGDGTMADWTSSTSVPWDSYRLSIKTVTLDDGVTNIGSYALHRCSALTSVDMPNVTSIGEYAFYYCNCRALTSVYMPNVTSIGSYAFKDCSALTSVYMPNVTSIGISAFSSCDALTSVDMPNVTSIGGYAFYHCDALTSVDMPNVTSIGSSAFAYCDALTSVEIPASVTNIGNGAFCDCSSLKKATIYSKTATFGEEVFVDTHADFEIHGYRGSTAETYANANSHTFVPLECVGEHSYELNSELSVAPTCTEGGTNVYVCTECGNTYEESVDALGHEITSIPLPPIDCDEEVLVGTCRRCGKEFYDPAPGHDYYELSDTATCTQAGVKIYVCGVCGEEKYVASEALGHNFVDRTCTRCGLNKYIITVEYVFEDGSKAFDSVSMELLSGEAYSISSPELRGYTSSVPVVYGVAEGDTETRVVYTPIELIKIVSFDSIDLGDKPYNTAFSALGLPVTVVGNTADGGTAVFNAVWSSESYSSTVYGEQSIKGTVLAKYGYVFECEAKVVATVNITNHIITAINEMSLGRLPLGTAIEGLGLPSTAAVTTSTGAIHYVPVEWNEYEYDPSVIGEHTIHGTVTLPEGFEFADGVENNAVITFELSDVMYGTADIVFLIDTTGSMGNEIANVKNNIKNFADALEREGVSSRYALLEYRDITCDGTDSTKIKYCGASEWYIDVDAYKNAIASLSVWGGGDLEETVIDALKAATYLESRDDAVTFYVVVTDASYKVENRYGIASMNQMISELSTAEIVTSVVTKTIYYDTYRSLTDGTGGILANIDGNFASELLKLLDLISGIIKYGTVTSIEITTPPNKTEYHSGDYFDGTGMVVTATYESGAKREENAYEVIPSRPLQISDTEITVNFRGKTDSVAITVSQTEYPVTSVSLSKHTLELNVGEHERISATVLPSNATNKNVIWATSNPNIATVTEEGVIEGVGAGSTTIIVTTADGGFTDTVTVTVVDNIPVEGVYLSVGAVDMNIGEQYTIIATVLPENATNKGVVWTSDNEDVVTVVNGVVNAEKIGNATVTVTTVDGNYKAMAYVVVSCNHILGDWVETVAPQPGVAGEERRDCERDGCDYFETRPIDALPVREILAQGYCGGEGDGTNLSWILYADGELVISGTGKMKDWTSISFVPWYSYRLSISTVTLGEDVTSIGGGAFAYCEGLTSIEIPASITSIGNWAVYNCTSLTSITVYEANAKYSSDEYGVLFNKDKTTLIQYPIGNSRTSYTIPNSVTSISSRAFYNCSDIQKVTIYSKTATFGSYVFQYTPADFEIHGYRGSTAETYANANGHTFVPIECVGEHDYVLDTDLSTAPTCTNIGTNVYVCTECGIRKVTTVNALGHDFEVVEVENASCTEDGYVLYECQNSGCDATKKQILSALGHDFGEDNICDRCGFILTIHEHDYEKTVVAPTCITIGYTVYTCDCGYSYRADYIESLGHKWDDGEVSVEKTCTTNGLVIYTCTRTDCGEKLSVTVQASHEWEETVTIEPTCTTDGEMVRECADCGAKETIVLPASHKWDEGVVTDEPDCTEGGKVIRTCTVCHDTKEFDVPALGHNFVNGICQRCGKKFIDVIKPETEHPEYGMYFKLDDVLSAYGTSLVDEYGVLLDYNNTASLDKVAVYLTQDGTMWRRAIACVGEDIDYATYVPYLSYEGEILYTGLNSSMINTFSLSENSDGIWEYSNYATIGVNLEDSYGNLLLSLYHIGQAGAKTRIFDDLDEMKAWLKADMCGHDFDDGEVTEDPTCTEAGFIVYTCTLCGDTKQVALAPLGHDMGEWGESAAPQPGVAGEERRDCERDDCDYFETRPIYANNTVTITVGDAKALAGKTVEIDIDIKDNSGFGGLQLNVAFDKSVLTLVGIDMSSSITDFTVTPIDIANEIGTIVFVHSALSNSVGDGNIAKLKFEVADNAEAGIYPITLSDKDSFYYDGMNMIDLSVRVEDGGVEVVDSILGDANGDGEINIRDVTLMLQYIAKWEVDIDESAADVTGDGEITIRDVTLVLQKIAGWNVL